jgi:hypothetical protein
VIACMRRSLKLFIVVFSHCHWCSFLPLAKDARICHFMVIGLVSLDHKIIIKHIVSVVLLVPMAPVLLLPHLLQETPRHLPSGDLRLEGSWKRSSDHWCVSTMQTMILCVNYVCGDRCVWTMSMSLLSQLLPPSKNSVSTLSRYGCIFN